MDSRFVHGLPARNIFVQEMRSASAFTNTLCLHENFMKTSPSRGHCALIPQSGHVFGRRHDGATQTAGGRTHGGARTACTGRGSARVSVVWPRCRWHSRAARATVVRWPSPKSPVRAPSPPRVRAATGGIRSNSQRAPPGPPDARARRHTPTDHPGEAARAAARLVLGMIIKP